MLQTLKNLWRRRAAPVEPAPAPSIPPAVSAFERYSALCAAAGVDGLYLVLTFDCDTDLDIDAARDLDRDLVRRGVRVGYAVPGVQLERGAETWRTIAASGAEFLNHGWRAHAEFRDDRYWPVTFYDRMSEDEVVEDVGRGHRTLLDVIGEGPEGFRAPHFGSFQAPEQLALLYRTLGPLGYRYCSTTTPALGLTRGPVVAADGLIELPTTGSTRHPTTLLDSWTYLTDRRAYRLGDEYFELFAETIERCLAERLPALLTYYADPAHVAGQRPFERVLDLIAARQVPSLQGREAIRRFRAI